MEKKGPDRRQAAAELKRALASLLRSEIRRTELNVYRLAQAAGVPQQTVRDAADGTSLPRVDVLLSLERALGRPAGWMCRRLAPAKKEDEKD